MAITTKKLIAEEYVVSSSVTLMTQSLSSGSTVFGDSLDDTHRMTGSLFVSGGISTDGSAGGTATFKGSSAQSTLNLQTSVDNFIVGLSNSSGRIDLRPAGTTALTAINSGNVGIGQTNPSYTLHVKSNDGLFLERAAGTYGLQVYADGAGSYIKASANDLQLWTGSTPSEKMRILQAGNVGIGTTSPASLLHVSGSNSGDAQGYEQIRIGSAGSYPSTITGLAFDNAHGHQSHIRFLQNGTVKMQIRYNEGSTTSNKLHFYSFITGTDFITFDANNGRVGIGTTNPPHNLSIYDTDSNVPTFNIFTDSAGNGLDIQQNGVNNFYFNRENGYIRFGTNNTTRMTILAGGNVGIGTSSPDASLHISSSVGSSTSSLHIEGSGSSVVAVDGTQGRLFSITDELSGSLFSANTISGLPVIEAFSDNRVTLGPYSDPVTVTSTGNVGIGTAVPTGQNANGPVLHLFGKNASGTLNEPQIVFQQTGEPAMSIGVNANLDSGAAMLFQTNNTSIRMVIREDGTVGIGTTAPSGDFVIQTTAASVDIPNMANGQLAVAAGSSTIYAGIIGKQTSNQIGLQMMAATPDSNSSTYGDMNFNIRENDDSEFATTSGKPGFVFSRYGTHLMAINRTGNVGIGTTNADEALLHMYKASTSANVNYIQMEMGGGWSAHPNYLKNITWSDGSAGNKIAAIGAEYDGSRGNLRFHSFYNGGYNSNVLFTMRGNGNFGIGSHVPSAKLEIIGGGITISGSNDTSPIQALLVKTSAASSQGYFAVEGDTAGAFITGTLARATVLASSANATALQLGSSGNVKMTILGTSSGVNHVGIGTAAPISSGQRTSLHIYGNHSSQNTLLKVEQDGASSSALIQIDSAADRDTAIYFQENGTSKAHIQNDASEDTLLISDGSDNDLLYLKGGALGIGTGTIPSGVTTIMEASDYPYLMIRNTATPDGSKIGGRLDFAFNNGTSKPTQTGDILGQIVWLGQGNDADYGSASIINTVTTGGSVGRANQVTKLEFTTKNSGENGASTAMTILGNGNVGIGETSPSEKLEVAGGIAFSGTATMTEATDLGKATIDTDGTDRMRFHINGANNGVFGGYEFRQSKGDHSDERLVMLIDETGQVGIGISAADGRLHVSNGLAGVVTANADADELVIENSGNAGISILTPDTSNGQIFFGDTSDNNVGIIDYDHNVNQLSFTVGATKAMTLNASANVGIGTTNPGSLLHLVSSNSEEPIITIENTNDNDGGPALVLRKNASNDAEADNDTCGNINFQGQDTGNNIHNFGQIKVNSADVTNSLEDGHMQLGVQYNGSASPEHAINIRGMAHGAYVGIGKAATNPVASLHVTGSTSVETAVFHGIGTAANVVFAYNTSLGQHKISWDSSKLYFSADHSSSQGSSLIGFLVDGTQRVTIDDSGRVGIGTTGPGYPLEVEGATGNTVAKFGQNMALHMIHNAPVIGFNLYYNSGYKFGEGSSSSYGGYLALSTGTGDFAFATSNAGNAGGAATMTERVKITNAGRVGIGTTSDIDAQLHIAGGSWSNSLVIQGNSTVSGIVFEDSSANKLGYVYAADTGVGFLDDDAAWAIRHVTDTNTEFRINNSVMATLTTTGLGLKTGAPQTELHIVGSGEFIRIENNVNASGNTYISFYDTSALKGNIGWTGGSSDHLVLYNNENADIRFFTNQVFRMGVDNNGNVGINEADPEGKLHVKTADSGVTVNSVADDLFVENNTHGGITIGTPNSVNGYLFFADPEDNAGAGINYNHATNKMSIAAGGTTRMVVSGSGRVGIGTDNPSQLLDVYGSIQVYSDIRLYNGTSIRFHGNGVVGMNSSATTQTFGTTAGSVNTHFSVGGITAAMMISGSTGNVGIGTTIPDVPLSFGVTSLNEQVIKLRQNGNSKTGLGITNQYGVRVFGPSDAVQTGANFEVGHVPNDNVTSTNFTSSFAVSYNGNVGIGTASPEETLHLYSSDNVEPTLKINSATTGNQGGQLEFVNSGTDADDNDIIGTIRFKGNNSANEETEYSTIYNRSIDVSNGTEDGEMHFRTIAGGTLDTRMIIQSKAVGIGTDSPTADRLHVRSATHTDSGGVMVVESGETGVDSGDILMILDFSGDSSISSANDYINFQDSGGEVGSIHSEVTYGTFTGGHVSQRPSGSDFSNWKPGMIVKSTGKILATGSSMALAWPEVELTTTQKDKAVMGVWEDNIPSGSHNDKYLNRSLPRIHYNAVGEGLIRVTDTNGNIETGDYICSSMRAGHGEKQDDDLMHNYTVAKATQPYNFASASNDSELGYKSVLIGCTYHCG